MGDRRATGEADAPTEDKRPLGFGWSLALATVALIAIVLLPNGESLPVAGQRMLAVFVFAVVVWITETLDYAVSALVIAALIAVLLGLSPDIADPETLIGTSRGLSTAMSGFSSSALTLVAAALFLSTAMTITGLDRRIALKVLARVGSKTSHVVIGGIVVVTLLAFLVPSATARAAAVIPIMMGIVLAFGAEKQSRFAGC
ncbi:SLC13 family permease [Mesorhizobium sp. Root157]|uniref:SLC13 family permease n=1 Tax=Mesorhizobium sp. Root157 TaxID=1736477 RepID=UPI000ABF1C85|nr:SLC13 family permease [Mesorhizobium sp. Root157]